MTEIQLDIADPTAQAIEITDFLDRVADNDVASNRHEKLSELVRNAKDQEASLINNAGQASQLRFLLESGHTADALFHDVIGYARDTPPVPGWCVVSLNIVTSEATVSGFRSEEAAFFQLRKIADGLFGNTAKRRVAEGDINKAATVLYGDWIYSAKRIK